MVSASREGDIRKIRYHLAERIIHMFCVVIPLYQGHRTGYGLAYFEKLP